MSHTKKYIDAMWVVENPSEYDPRQVLDAKRYTSAYLEGFNQALTLNNPKKEITNQSNLDCPYDFTSRCTMGSCDCKIKTN